MDEPFSALDPLIRREMQEEFIDLQSRIAKTIIFVTHDLDEAILLGNRIAIINKEGKIVQIGTPSEIATNPANGYVEKFTEKIDTKKLIKAKDVMKKPTIVLHPKDTPKTALRMMSDFHLENAIVVDKKREFLGVLIGTKALLGER